MFHVVNLENSKHLNQFNVLKNISEKIILTENTTRTITGVMDLPYDVNLVVHNETELELKPFSFNPITNTINLMRYHKAAQAVLLTKFMKGMSFEHYNQLPTYTVNKDTVTLPEGRYVFKLSHGARSMAVFSAQVGRHSARAIVGHISKCMDEFRRTKNSGGLITDPDVHDKKPATEPQPIPTYHACVEQLRKSLHDLGITFKLGEENYEYEAVDMYIAQGIFAQWHVGEFFVELRLLRSLKGVVIIMGREDLENDHISVSTHIQSEDHFINYLLKLGSKVTRGALSKIYNEIMTCVGDKAFPGRYGSVDVWVALNTVRWGIFEFQPQYSSLNIPDNTHNQFLHTCLGEFLDVATEKEILI